MLKELTDLELSEISSGVGDICSWCEKGFSNNQKIVCIIPTYRVYDISAEKFTGDCESIASLVCNKVSCISKFKNSKKRSFQIGDKVYIPTNRPKMEYVKYIA